MDNTLSGAIRPQRPGFLGVAVNYSIDEALPQLVTKPRSVCSKSSQRAQFRR